MFARTQATCESAENTLHHRRRIYRALVRDNKHRNYLINKLLWLIASVSRRLALTDGIECDPNHCNYAPQLGHQDTVNLELLQMRTDKVFLLFARNGCNQFRQSEGFARI